MIYDKINLMLATYKRVNNGRMQPFIESSLSMANDPKNLIMTFLINVHDEESKNYLENYPNKDKFYDWEILYEDLPAPNLSYFFNAMFKGTRNKQPGTLVTMVGDDMRWETKDYDIKILEEMNNRNGNALIYVNDDYCQRGAICVNMFITRELADAASVDGNWMPEIFPVDYSDTCWTDFARENDLLCYLGDIILKHEHSTKVGFDPTYERLRSNFGTSLSNLSGYREYVDKMNENYRNAKN